jgi:pSer/pThr/pTyr-binding forkhead associated (FHA) protein
MLPIVSLSVTRGFMDGEEFSFSEPTVCIVGRAVDCHPRIVGDGLVSRHHCRMVIDPPQIWVSDLSSSNGTYVNGSKLSGDPTVATALEDGDELELGLMSLRVKIHARSSEIPPPNFLGAHCPDDQCCLGLA